MEKFRILELGSRSIEIQQSPFPNTIYKLLQKFTKKKEYIYNINF